MPSPVSQSNHQTYGHPDIASEYGRMSHLDAAEERVLSELAPTLSDSHMLDIGVGGGRTTLHFAKWVRSYVGIDYAPAMIEHCRRRFASYPGAITFDVCDARDLGAYANNQFDFVLFSFNGIDYVPSEDRRQVFEEIRRVGKPGGHFCFSTHNLQAVPDMLKLRNRLHPNPVRLIDELGHWMRLRYLHNDGLLARDAATASSLTFNDGAHGFRLRTHYIRPAAQLAELRADFDRVCVLSPSDGRRLDSPDELDACVEPWLYFLCRFR